MPGRQIVGWGRGYAVLGFLVWLREAVGAIKRGAYKARSWIGLPITRLPELKPPTDRRGEDAVPASPEQERRKSLTGRGSGIRNKVILPSVVPKDPGPSLSEDVQETAEVIAQVLNSRKSDDVRKGIADATKTPRND